MIGLISGRGWRELASRILRARVQTIPSPIEQTLEPAGFDWLSEADEEGLAELAPISGQPLDNRSVSTFIQTLNNTTIAAIAAASGATA